MKEKFKKVPLWKWIVLVMVVIGMPTLFLCNRIQQTQNAIVKTEPPANAS